MEIHFLRSPNIRSCLMLCALALSGCGGGDDSAPGVIVPNVVGDSQVAAATAITGAGLTTGTVTMQTSGTVASGLVISESPGAGSNVAGGSTVSLIISTGPPAPSATFTLLYSFSNGVDGGCPLAPLMQASDGNFYGTTTTGGGGAGVGTVFEFTPGSVPQTLHVVNPASDGSYPIGGLVEGANGLLYGTMSGGGAGAGGTAFTITTTGTYKVIHTFVPSTTDGGEPNGLFLANDGNFYGTLEIGGLDAVGDAPGNGAIFQLTPSGQEVVTYFFQGASDGFGPNSTLVQDANGFLWGTNSGGGANGNGVIFAIQLNGSGLVTEYSYGVYSGGTDEPYVPGLILGPYELLYGASVGLQDSDDLGSIYSISETSPFKTVYTFASVSTGGGLANLSNGAGPEALPVLGKDGNFYGVTAGGGTSDLEDQNGGTIYQLTPRGVLTNLYTFQPTVTQSSRSSLIQGKDGNFYGTTCAEGANGVGSIYELSLQ